MFKNWLPFRQLFLLIAGYTNQKNYIDTNKYGNEWVTCVFKANETPPSSSLPTSVSRAAGMALTKAMSKDLGKDNIRVNTVCIGLVRSEQMEKSWKKHAPELSWEEFPRKERQIPLGW